MPTRLFVYGSLKRGFRHHHELTGASYLGEVRTAAAFELVLAGEYPALVRGGVVAIHGELYLVEPALLARLDDFEDCPTLYQRELLRLSDGSQASAYLMQRARVLGLPRIGDRWSHRG